MKKLENFKEIERKLYIVLMKSTAVGYDNEIVRTFGCNLIENLMGERKSSFELHSEHIKSTLDTLDALDSNGDDTFEQIIVLHGIICLCGLHVTMKFYF